MLNYSPVTCVGVMDVNLFLWFVSVQGNTEAVYCGTNYSFFREYAVLCNTRFFFVETFVRNNSYKHVVATT
jgi:hypothetical protein